MQSRNPDRNGKILSFLPNCFGPGHLHAEILLIYSDSLKTKLSRKQLIKPMMNPISVYSYTKAQIFESSVSFHRPH